jgi:hypothetical protein
MTNKPDSRNVSDLMAWLGIALTLWLALMLADHLNII